MTVYLIGDSVRLASEPYTRAALPEADIVSPSENCRSSHDVLEQYAVFGKRTQYRQTLAPLSGRLEGL